MFDKLLDFLLDFVSDILPFFVIKEYDKGVLLRFGKFRKVLDSGFHFKIPFVDTYDSKTYVTTTLTIPTQSLTTKDDKQVVVKSVVKYNIFDIKPFILEVNDAVDAISDVTQSIIKEQITQKTWEGCRDNQLDSIITKKLRVEIKKWGIEVEKVTLTDIGLIRSIRLFNENITND